MAKAVLVMDDMPECCADCYCGYFERDTKELNLVCGATGEDANNAGDVLKIDDNITVGGDKT